MLGFMAAASVALHAGIVVGVGYVALRGLDNDARRGLASARAVSVAHARPFELPVVSDGTMLVDREPDRTGDPVRPAGGDAVAHLDTGESGAGGDVAVDAPALNLANKNDLVRLSPDEVSRLDRDQIQRIRTGNERASWEDRRATTHPTELTFLATGLGKHEERRAVSAANPSRGAVSANAAEVRGGELGAPANETATRSNEATPRIGMAVLGSLGSSPGVGIREAQIGLDHRASAAVAHARPDLVEGPVATPALLRGRARDEADTDQEVATAVRALVHASTAGGARGIGRGGNGAGGDPGAGAESGKGSHARTLGLGVGDWLDFDTNDPRLLPYFRHLHAKIDPLWRSAFPKEALAELKQGTVILDFTIHQDGSVSVTWPPTRPSGIDEFDRKCADAIRRAGPFEAIPSELGTAPLHIRAPFTARNPIIH